MPEFIRSFEQNLRLLPRKIFDCIQTYPKETVRWIGSHKKQAGLIALGLLPFLTLPITIGQIESQRGAYYDLLRQGNMLIDSNLVGHYVLASIQSMTHMLSVGIFQSHPEDVALVHLAESLQTAYVGGTIISILTKLGYQRLTEPSKREVRMLTGIEPLRKKEIPSHVFIGPAQIASDLAKKVVEKGTTYNKNHPIVVVHPDDVVPARYGQEVNYHIKGDIIQLLDTFPPSKKEISFIEASGIDRALELTFICINPENAIFYGYDTRSLVQPADVSSVINKIPQEKLEGKIINIIMPQAVEIGETSKIKEELKGLAERLKFKLNFIEPEELFIQRMEAKIKTIAEQKGDGKVVELTILGQGGEEKDRLMLERMGMALSALKLGRKIKVNIVKRQRQSNKEEEKLRKVFKRSDYIICYGDIDTGTTSLVRLLMEHFKVPKEKIGAVIEKISMFYDISELDKENIFCIYQMVTDQFSQT